MPGKSEVLVLSHVELCNSMECNLPGSSVHGILQARMLEWVAMPSSRGLSPQGPNPYLLRLRYWRQILYQ